MSDLRGFVPRLAGKLAVSWAVRRWAANASMFGGPYQSPTFGGSWSLGQYALALLVAKVGSRFVGRFLNAREFEQGAMDLILSKAVWTEGFARSQWMQQAFGQTDGEIRQDSSGQTWISQGGRWTALQGYGDTLVQAGPMDGLVERTPLDGEGASYGHLLPEGVSEATQRVGLYTSTGAANPYVAAYQSR